MKFPHHFLMIVAVALIVPAGLAAQGKSPHAQSPVSSSKRTQTLTGVIGDAVCGRKHAMGGKSDADCTRECVRRGSQYILIAGERIHILKGAPGDKLDRWAGARVVVSGTVQGDTILVTSVTAESSRYTGAKD
jgi:hypothetical protein